MWGWIAFYASTSGTAATLTIFALVIVGLILLVRNRTPLPGKKAWGVFGLCLTDFILDLGLWFIVFFPQLVFSGSTIMLTHKCL
ncbi:hypothetical protein B9Q04_19835 [Candidatus Marsarchaeota G2 archaeon BE_D]|uniref:Uncharacterized protein n=1 Tax=Candidatus Marsarchaeota G2 archaeon BE_D TaxID=1978158 RepID=A0A2R6BZ51_9ARCH|nr:MAG: hypothetical protein B9Q04_19835 [Candidatus Marsarchaeota G2 archaeon BE_D]